ncbi:subclass B3 metallo-beta-lactamase [Noviherbaspirillum galbum]|uniref:Subclass B3 metallo-beta-lactamase n=1 Tax=Noviherbaspirillum galbum TaxID=2709383 RepID=A0A6B3SS59_9BURK|nr:subclass B3 metallo-beta-lactamase [Noviherbaspirillum galbum]NEX62185.1 subclass B3 metallo-beta-lactamase [Noviherbaspirillum galbum]
MGYQQLVLAALTVVVSACHTAGTKPGSQEANGERTAERYTQPSSVAPEGPATYASCVNDPSWIAPQKPFRIYGNTWNVGPRGLGVFLITAPTGHVLIDGGVPGPGGAPLIEANIRSLGIDLHDIKWILNSHEHCDHAGGITQLAKDTGAQVIASTASIPMLESGGHNDPQYGDSGLYTPMRVTRTVTDGESLRLGDLLLTAHLTPGHTRGNTTWTWLSCEGARCLNIVDVGSLSAPDYKLVDNPNSPDIVKDYESSFTLIAALPCDIALAPHPGMVDFWDRAGRREQGATDAFIDPTLCRAYATNARKSFDKELTKQRDAAASVKR